MILLTGATGNVGSKVADILAQQGIKFRATSRTPQSQHDDGHIDWHCVDFNDKDTINPAVSGINTLILITPADEQMVTHQTNIIEAATAAGVNKIIKLSGLGAGPDAPIRLPKRHYEIEETLKKVAKDHNMNYIFVRPNLFMQAVIYGSLESIKKEGKIYAPVGHGKISVIDVTNVAEVIAHAAIQDDVNDPISTNAIIEITGPEALSFGDMAQKFSQQVGSPVDFVAVSFEDAKNGMLAAGMDAWLVDAFIELYAIYEQGMGASVLTDDLTALLHKSPSRFDEVLATVSFD